MRGDMIAYFAITIPNLLKYLIFGKAALKMITAVLQPSIMDRLCRESTMNLHIP